MKTTYIFDLDGVIVDTAKYHYLAWKKIADEYGMEFDEELNEQLKGVSRVKCLDILMAHSNVVFTQQEKDLILKQKNDIYLDYIDQLTPDELLPGVQDLFDYCKDNGFYICLGSASKNAQFILEKLAIEHYFDVVIDGNQVVKAKPHPEVFAKAAEILQVPPQDCIVFEDSIAGILAAKNAGMYAVGVGQPDVLVKADIVVRDLEGFIALGSENREIENHSVIS